MSTINTYKISRVNSLPETRTDNTIYFVKDATEGSNLAELYITGNNGTLRHLPTISEINTKIGAAVSNIQPLAVANIEARDALELQYNNLVLVLDASGDTTVNSGPAMYFYTVPTETGGTGTWTKVSEWESMDVSMTWDSISGKPTSLVEDIDAAVNMKHIHSNESVLTNLDTNEDGKLTLSGTVVDTTYSPAVASTDGVGGSDGLLTAADKETLDKVSGGDFENQNAFSYIEDSEGNSYAATDVTDSFSVIGGAPAITTSLSGSTLTINVADAAAADPTSGHGLLATSGLMSGEDKTKLDRITINEYGNICIDGVALGTLLSAEEW